MVTSVCYVSPKRW